MANTSADTKSQHERPGGGVDSPLEVAVVGGGIIGLMVALGLLRRGLHVTIFEQAQELGEISAGFAFTAVARECMRRLDPRLVEALDRVGGSEPSCIQSLLGRIQPNERSRGSVTRGVALQVLAEYTDDETKNKVTLSFTDGSSTEVDCVIGCDGIRSRTKQLLLGQDSLASYPTFSHKVAYRAVIPIDDAIAAFGHEKANNQCTHMGLDATVISYPVAQWTLSNIVIFIHQPDPWTHEKMTAPATKDEIWGHLSGWSPSIQKMVESLPEKLTKWAIFDTADNPATTYARGRVCIAGDAGHASSPFLGAGACMGVEDALVLSVALDLATDHIQEEGTHTRKLAISSALEAYSDVRRDRSQWLVRASREVGDLYQWRNRVTGRDTSKCRTELEKYQRKLWDWNVDEMVTETGYNFLRLMEPKELEDCSL
ncbi:hypothetical protein NM208_g8460 [Fusarium decemcellulare]|uniref:Uncharacterized protein n=1 Tax=Fusarium decemcellulare TaxID=57161 RepID=A0ACC1S5A9_9HYPO|nr:hypothetical protein NM208_g8460 [Fusarium decemcellulare]